MTPCESFLFNKNELSTLKQLVVITFFIQIYHIYAYVRCYVLYIASYMFMFIFSQNSLQFWVKARCDISGRRLPVRYTA